VRAQKAHLDFRDANQEDNMAHGGKRKGAGRPKGAGLYGEATERLRVPASMVPAIKQFVATSGFTLPLFSSRVQAGYAMPADEHVEERIDLNSYLVDDPEETFLVHATGDSMNDAGIRDGTLLVVNRRVKPVHGKVVVAAVDGQVTVKYLIVKKDKAYLMPANPAFHEIPIDSETGVTIWGVVTSSIQSH
jgi:DNA polymerase V